MSQSSGELGMWLMFHTHSQVYELYFGLVTLGTMVLPDA